MENTTGSITPFLIGPLPRKKYSDVNEFAKDLADNLRIDTEKIVVTLIPSADIKGDKGDKGDRGKTGGPGPQGAPGATGATGDPGAAIVWEGPWALLTDYQVNDLVSNGGVTYICIVLHTADADKEPGVGADWADYWEIFPLNIVLGVTDGGDAAAGDIGEIISSIVAVGGAVALTTATNADVTSLALTAGDWDVEATVHFTGAAATVTGLQAGVHTTTATLPTDGSEGYSGLQTTTTSFIDSICLMRKRFALAAPDTIFLVALATFSAGTVGAFGQINARRVR